MKYTSLSFTLPAAPPKVTQAEWTRIFGEPRKKKGKQLGRKSDPKPASNS